MPLRYNFTNSAGVIVLLIMTETVMQLAASNVLKEGQEVTIYAMGLTADVNTYVFGDNEQRQDFICVIAATPVRAPEKTPDPRLPSSGGREVMTACLPIRGNSKESEQDISRLMTQWGEDETGNKPSTLFTLKGKVRLLQGLESADMYVLDDVRIVDTAPANNLTQRGAMGPKRGAMAPKRGV